MLTGGIAGELTGTNEQIRRERALNRAMLQEEFQKRDEERAMRRALMTNALQQGIELDPNAPIEQMISKLRSEGVKGEIAKSQGRIFGLGQSVGPSQYEADPRYQLGVLGGQRELAENRAAAAAKEEIERPLIEAEIRGFGGTPTPGAPTGQLRGERERIRMETQSKIPLEQRGEQAKANLKAYQGVGAFPAPFNVDSLTNQQAISWNEIYGRRFQQESEIGHYERTQKSQQEAFNKFNEEASLDNPDPNKLKGLYSQLPASLQRDPEIKRTANIFTAPTATERKTLFGWKDTLGRATNLAESIAALAGTEDLAKVSQSNFNSFKSWFRGLQNKYGTEDPRLNTINDIVQQFEKVISGTRKDLFAASLTGNELESAKQQFGDPNSANFLPRMVQFLDDVFSKDLVAEYRDSMIAVPPGAAKSAEEARQNWLKTREQFNFGNLGAPRKTTGDRIQGLREEAARLRNSLGLTNAPATTR
jgi:hypothetical protein